MEYVQAAVMFIMVALATYNVGRMEKKHKK